jgi:hypothetical protein
MSTIGAAGPIDANPPLVCGVVPPQSRTTAPHALGSATTSYVSGVGVIRRAEFTLWSRAVHLRAGAAPARGRALSPWTDTCGYTAHDGFGPQLVGSAVQETGWYDTDVRALDLVLHDRVRAVRVPHRRPSPRVLCLRAVLRGPRRGAAPLGLQRVRARHAGAGAGGPARRAFRVEGRGHTCSSPGASRGTSGGRPTAPPRGGPSSFSSAVQNMTALAVEASAPGTSTTAFHPVDDDDVFLWQDSVRGLQRPYLFAYAGERRGTTDDGKSIYNQPPRRAVRGVAQLLAA